MTRGTVTWDQTDPGNIVVVVQADGKAQAFNGRTVEEAQGRIAGVMVSEFRFSQPEADDFARMAAEQREAVMNTAIEHKAKLSGLLGENKELQSRIAQLTTKVTAAEQERDTIKAAHAKALSDLRAAQGALETAVADRQRLDAELTAAKAASEPPSPPPPAAPPQESADANKGTEAKP